MFFVFFYCLYIPTLFKVLLLLWFFYHPFIPTLFLLFLHSLKYSQTYLACYTFQILTGLEVDLPYLLYLSNPQWVRSGLALPVICVKSSQVLKLTHPLYFQVLTSFKVHLPYLLPVMPVISLQVFEVDLPVILTSPHKF